MEASIKKSFDSLTVSPISPLSRQCEQRPQSRMPMICEGTNISVAAAHAFFFVTFVLTSIVYMIFSCFLLKWKRVTPASRREKISLKLKFFLTVTNLSGFFLAGYNFVRHNTYCEAGGMYQEGFSP